MLARSPWGQILGEGNIEGELERQVGMEGCGVNTFRTGQVERVKGRRKTSSAGTGEEGRGGEGTSQGSLDAFGMAG